MKGTTCLKKPLDKNYTHAFSAIASLMCFFGIRRKNKTTTYTQCVNCETFQVGLSFHCHRHRSIASLWWDWASVTMLNDRYALQTYVALLRKPPVDSTWSCKAGYFIPGILHLKFRTLPQEHPLSVEKLRIYHRCRHSCATVIAAVPITHCVCALAKIAAPCSTVTPTAPAPILSFQDWDRFPLV